MYINDRKSCFHTYILEPHTFGNMRYIYVKYSPNRNIKLKNVPCCVVLRSDYSVTGWHAANVN